MKLQAFLYAAVLCLTTSVVEAAEPPLKIVATQVVQPALTDLQPTLSARAGVPVTSSTARQPRLSSA